MPEINDIEEIIEGDFPINLKMIEKYQRTEPSLMDEYKNGTYHTYSFCGGSNIDLNLIMCEDNIISGNYPNLRIKLVLYVSPSSSNG